MRETLLRKIEEASARIRLKKKRGPGRPRKLSDAEAAFLAAVREHHHQMPYRELAISSYAKRLGIKIHYTNLRIAIERLPERLLRETMRLLAELVSSERVDCVVDATSFALDCYGERAVGSERRRTRKNTKLSAVWDAETNVFYGGIVLEGEAHEGGTLPELIDGVRKGIGKAIADPAYASRENVQFLADRGIEPIIKPRENATRKSGGSFAWRKLVSEYQELGYERWKNKTGYDRRFEEEHAFAALIVRFGDKVRAKCPRIASKLIQIRLILHNLFAALYHRRIHSNLVPLMA